MTSMGIQQSLTFSWDGFVLIFLMAGIIGLVICIVNLLAERRLKKHGN